MRLLPSVGRTINIDQLADSVAFFALYEEQYPHALFDARAGAAAWITERPETDYTFAIEGLTVSSNG